jgi:phage baseplate assembly protein W
MSDVGRILGRSMAFPPRVGADGRVAFSEGDTNIRESIEIVLRTAPGERLRMPDFGAGLERFLFEPNTTATRKQIQDRIARALRDWEPRVSVQEITVTEDPGDRQAAIATVIYRLVATQLTERVSLTVGLGA